MRSLLKRWFETEQEREDEVQAGDSRPEFPRSPRIHLTALHRVTFRGVDRPADTPIYNLSTAGVGLSTDHLKFPIALGDIIEGQIVFSPSDPKASSFPVRLRVKHF